MKILAIVALLYLIGSFLGPLLSSRRSVRISSFWDLLRNPEALPDEELEDNDPAATARSISGDSGRIAQLVDFYIFEATSSSSAWNELEILGRLGSEAYPRVLEILSDPSLKGRLTELTHRGFTLPEGPINRLCKILSQDVAPPNEAVRMIATYLQSESEDIRKSAAMVIGVTAQPSSLLSLRTAITDENEHVRCYALLGLQEAINRDRIIKSDRIVFFELVASMWPDDTSFNICDILPCILLQLDRNRAIQYLLSEERFSVQFDPLYRILEAFRKASIEVPRARLLPIISDASNDPLNYPIDRVLEQALPLLGAQRNKEDRVVFWRLLDHSNENVVRGATEALYAFHQYHDVIRKPMDIVQKHGWRGLTEVEKHVLAVKQLDGQVKNGGFAQYYFNSFGDQWKYACEGLAAMGAEKHSRIMRETIQRFGNIDPAVDRKARSKQLSRIVHEKEDPFRDQDRQWCNIDDENLDRLIFKYDFANLHGRNKKGFLKWT